MDLEMIMYIQTFSMNATQIHGSGRKMSEF